MDGGFPTRKKKGIIIRCVRFLVEIRNFAADTVSMH